MKDESGEDSPDFYCNFALSKFSDNNFSKIPSLLKPDFHPHIVKASYQVTSAPIPPRN
jgi:hypothetical protein